MSDTLHIVGVQASNQAQDESEIQGYMTLNARNNLIKFYSKADFFEKEYMSENSYKVFNIQSGEAEELEVYYLDKIKDSFFLKSSQNKLLNLPKYSPDNKKPKPATRNRNFYKNIFPTYAKKSLWY